MTCVLLFTALQGIAYIEPWFDGSVILIRKQRPPKENDVYLWSVFLPFETNLWIMIIGTVIVSAFIFQILEYFGGERDDRSLSQWTRDSIYLSFLNFTQNYEYAPSSPGSRLYGVSMAIWSLVIAATYTANLASLFVEQHAANAGDFVTSIDEGKRRYRLDNEW